MCETVTQVASAEIFMRVLVGDVLGQCRLMDVWSNSVLARVSGNKDEKPDRSWACNAMTSFADFSKACIVHSSGCASFFSTSETLSRTSVLSLCDPKVARSVAFEGDKFVSCFSGKCVTFNEDKKIGEFDTVECSCAASFDGQAAYGRIADRTLVYDIASGDVKWTAADPPFDELKIQLKDDDRSLLWMNRDTLVVGQNDGVALVYDLRSGNEAVVRANPFPEFPLTAIGSYDDKVVFGDTVGSLTIMDLNMPMKRFDGFKGFDGAPAGTVQISKHPTLPILAVLTCDRVIRLYDVTKPLKTAEKTAFVKVMSFCMSILNDSRPETDDEADEDWDNLPEDSSNLWGNFVVCPQAKPKE